MYRVDLAYLILAPIGIVLMLVPFMAHFRALNTATCYMIAFTTLGALLQFVNTLVWHDSLEDYAPIWCDISAKLQIGLSLALPLASLCINRRLAGLRNMTVSPHTNMRRREAIIDSLICIVPTVMFMAIHYTQQGHRYDLIQGFGCWASTYITEPGFILVMLPPLLISMTSCVFAVLSLRFFWKCRSDFDKYLRNSGGNMTKSSYTRLMLLASCELFIALPAQLTLMGLNIRLFGIAHWISWADTKYGFARHNTFSRYMIGQSQATVATLETSRWLYPFCCLLFFIFFGFSKEVFRSWYQVTAAISSKVFRKDMPSWDQYEAASSSRKSKPITITLFGRTIVISTKKAHGNSTFMSKSVSVALPHNANKVVDDDLNRNRRDSFGFSVVSADGDAAAVMAEFEDKEKYQSYNSSVTEKDIPELDYSGLDTTQVHVEIERVERRD